jgi:hypothetical protein
MCMVAITNTAKMQNFEVISDKFKIGIRIKIVSETCLRLVEIKRDKQIALRQWFPNGVSRGTTRCVAKLKNIYLN